MGELGHMNGAFRQVDGTVDGMVDEDTKITMPGDV